ncbi:MAG: hypothetical protein AAF221_13745 [Pseudomonadota bacterium]
MANLTASALQPQTVTILANGEGQGTKPASKVDKSGFSFGDFIDMINPLHHIPVVGQVYRAVTGDQISDTARMAGGGLFAGPLGIGIAAGTIALRGDRAGAEAPAAPASQDDAQTVSLPVIDGLDGYQKIAAKHWTPANLAALSASVQGNMGSELKTKSDDEPADAQQPSAAPVPAVAAAPLQQPNPAQNAQVWTQMLSNLEKYEAMTSPQR